jgi:hypothetical protein
MASNRSCCLGAASLLFGVKRVITAQTATLTNQRTGVDIGDGGWDTTSLPKF